MAEVTINIKGRSYDIACDDGQERRVIELADYIDTKMQQIMRTGAAYNESHLMVLTSLVLADELFDARDSESGAASNTNMTAANDEDDKAIALILDKMTKRIEGIAMRLQEVS